METYLIVLNRMEWITKIQKGLKLSSNKNIQSFDLPPFIAVLLHGVPFMIQAPPFNLIHESQIQYIIFYTLKY